MDLRSLWSGPAGPRTAHSPDPLCHPTRTDPPRMRWLTGPADPHPGVVHARAALMGDRVQPRACSAGSSRLPQCRHRYSSPVLLAQYTARTAGPHRSQVSFMQSRSRQSARVAPGAPPGRVPGVAQCAGTGGARLCVPPAARGGELATAARLMRAAGRRSRPITRRVGLTRDVDESESRPTAGAHQRWVSGRQSRPRMSVVATPTGLEPATSAVTGRRSNQLSYGA
jgi:hypothetical protein